MEELFESVWKTPAFHEAADRLRRNWLCRELGMPFEPQTPAELQKVVQASAILACSRNQIIVDEAHSVADGGRGVLLQWVVDDLLRRRSGAQLMFASPGVQNLDVFGQMFGLGDVDALPSAEPTVAQNLLKVTVEDPEVGDVLVQAFDEGRMIEIGTVPLRRRCVTRVERIVALTTSFGHGASNIIYANGAGDAETLADAIAERLERAPTSAQIALARLVAENVHRDYLLVKCVRKGVAFHYSNMPTPVRQAIEDAVRSGDIDYLVCTTTLLQGVNLPAKNLFICKPYKGDNIPLESVDFWNLVGRAGRLLKEFQGNIFLIDYDNWRKKPLDSPRSAAITPAVDAGILQKSDALIGVIERAAGSRADNEGLESVFGRLLDDRLHDQLPLTLARVPGFDPEGATAIRLVEAIANAAGDITLPSSVLRNSPNISPHKQQDLYEELLKRGSLSKDAALGLIPLHPRNSEAYASYCNILELCHRTILNRPSTSRLHLFLGLICLYWMRGRPLPMIVHNQLRRKRPEDDDRDVIRATLKLVENEVRYQCLRLFSCYSAILVEVLRNLGREDALARLPSISLFLELGASDRTTLSLMAMNLSRVVAVRLTAKADSRDLDLEQARAWLQTAPIETFGFSPLLEREIRLVRGERLD